MTTEQSTNPQELVRRLELGSEPAAITADVLKDSHSRGQIPLHAASELHVATSAMKAIVDRGEGDLIAQERDQWAAAVDAAERQILRLTEKAAELERPFG